MDPTLISACTMFLVPATILFAAIGIARTEALKALVSAMGVVFSAIWWQRIDVWTGLTPPDRTTALWFAGTFLVASAISAVVHVVRWFRGDTEQSR